jgi:predicted Zn-dependent protease
MRLDPRNRDYLFEQGAAYDQLGQWQESISALKGYLARYPEDFWSHVFLADDYSGLGENDAAHAEAAEVERAVARGPNSAVGYLGASGSNECYGEALGSPCGGG